MNKIIIIFILLAPIQSISQGYELEKLNITLQKNWYEGGLTFDNNNNLIASGSSEIHKAAFVKLSPQLELLWEEDMRQFTPNCGNSYASNIISLDDGTIISAGMVVNNRQGGDADWQIISLNIYGKKNWIRNIGNWQDDRNVSISVNKDEDIILGGQRRFDYNSSFSTINRGFIVKLDKNGLQKWEQVIGKGEDRIGLNDIKTSNNSIYSVGSIVGKDDISKILLVKLDGDGQIIYEKKLNENEIFEENNFVEGFELEIKDNKLFILTGNNCSGKNYCKEASLIQTDTLGNVVNKYAIKEGFVKEFILTKKGDILLIKDVDGEYILERLNNSLELTYSEKINNILKRKIIRVSHIVENKEDKIYMTGMIENGENERPSTFYAKLGVIK